MTIRVLLVEDHALVRAGIRALLEASAGIDVVGEASDGREALRKIKETPVDVAVMDVTMPGLNGLEAAARIRKSNPEIKVLILSMYANEEYVIQALRQGAVGYLVKDSAAPELEKAIQTVARGEYYLSGEDAKARLEKYLEGTKALQNPLDRLTPRQREILQLVVEGRKTREIAQILSVSVKTVETHRAQLMDRLGIHDVAGLVRYAIRIGLITPHI